MVRSYVDIYYATNEDVVADRELQAWWQGLRAPHSSKVCQLAGVWFARFSLVTVRPSLSGIASLLELQYASYGLARATAVVHNLLCICRCNSSPSVVGLYMGKDAYT